MLRKLAGTRPAVEIDPGGAQVESSAAALTKLAEQLRSVTAQFQV
ncbi:MAG: hypothetical protein QM765_36155 [Myxococcales bacterium]